VGLGRHDDAFVLFLDRLQSATLYRLAAHRDRVQWLEQLFPDGVACLPTLTRGRSQSHAINALALSYKAFGQPGRSVPLLRGACEIDERLGDDSDRQTALENLALALHEIGALREAIGASRQAVVLSRELEDKFSEGTSLRIVGKIFGSMGAEAFAHLALDRSRHLHMEGGRRQPEGVSSADLAELTLWVGDLVKANAWAERAWELAAGAKNEPDFIHATLLQGRVALGAGDVTRGEERLHHALTRARVVNVVEFELSALIAIAELELRRGDTRKGKDRLEDVWEAGERGPYPLRQADAFNVLTAIELAEGNRPAAIAAATNAYKAAWCDGPPFAYHWGLEKAKAHLATLGAPEPKLPPFDESKFEPMPEVEINPKDEYWVDPDNLD
jgi:tetratricopeptide (TPR) repeat protein